MALPSLHPCKPSPIARPADKPCRWTRQGTSLGPAGASPGPGKPPVGPPFAQQGTASAARLCYEMPEPHALPEDGGAGEGRRVCSWDQGQLKLTCRGTGRSQAEQGSPDASGTVEGQAVTSASVGHPQVTEPRVAGCHAGSSPARAGARGRSGRPPALPALALAGVTNEARRRAGTRLKQVREVEAERRECENRFSWKSEGNISMGKKKRKKERERE